jgi:hypothetical protein
VTVVPIQLKNDWIFDDEVSDLLFRSMDPFLIGMFDDGDTPRPVIRMVSPWLLKDKLRVSGLLGGERSI